MGRKLGRGVPVRPSQVPGMAVSRIALQLLLKRPVETRPPTDTSAASPRPAWMKCLRPRDAMPAARPRDANCHRAPSRATEVKDRVPATHREAPAADAHDRVSKRADVHDDPTPRRAGVRGAPSD